jgi:hypothetical protein
LTHDIEVEHYQSDKWGEMATPVPATHTYKGRFQHDSRLVMDSSGQEVMSLGYVFLPAEAASSIGPLDRIVFAGKTYRILEISKPRFESETPSYVGVRVI